MGTVTMPEPLIDEEEVWEALKAVTDPEIGIDVVNTLFPYTTLFRSRKSVV